jgi:hypothetical protein
MNLKLFHNFLFTLTLSLIPTVFCSAQTPIPWFLGEKATWEILSKKAVALPVAPSLSKNSLRIHPSQYKVATTPKNWMLHRFSHSRLMSDSEKKRLLNSDFSSPENILGKIQYIHDRDAALFSFLQNEIVPLNTQAFSRRSELLKNVYTEFENYYISTLAYRLSSTIFPQEQIKFLLLDPSQPPLFVLRQNEIKNFPTLSLEEQKNYAKKIVEESSFKINSILTSSIETLAEESFHTYYFQKLRFKYFTMLQQALENASSARKSIIIRMRKKPGINFLQGGQTFMTDAQRLGFLRFYHDKYQLALTPNQAPSEQFLEIKKALNMQEKMYEYYAVAEAFNLPYEEVFVRTTSSAPLYIENGVQLQENLQDPNFTSQVEPYIQDITKQLRAMQAQTPTSLDFFTRYFRLTHQLDIYDLLTMKNRMFLKYK